MNRTQDMKLSEMDRQSLNNLLLPLLRLRQSCCHPQAVKGKLFLLISGYFLKKTIFQFTSKILCVYLVTLYNLVTVP